MGRSFVLWGLCMLGVNAALGADDQADPHQWLEDVSGEKALAWVKERNAESTGPLTSGEGFEPLRSRFLDILNSTARIPMISKAGPHY